MEIGNSNIASNNQTVLGNGQSDQVAQASKLQAQSNDTSSLSAGKIFQGEILDIKGSQVSIGLENGQVLNAKMEANVNLSIGQKLMFEVKSNTGVHIEIKPALDGGNPNPVLQNALKAANIMITDRNMEMVSNMIKEGMSIDKQSLSNMLRQFNINSDTDAATIIKMNKLGIIATPENAEQFENYKNYEHRIVKGIDNIANNLVNLLSETSSEDKNLSVSFNNKLVDILNNNYSTDNNGASAKQEISIPFNKNTPIQNGQIYNDNILTENKTSDLTQMIKGTLENPFNQEINGTNINKEMNTADSVVLNNINNEDYNENKLNVNSNLDNINTIVKNESQNTKGTNATIDSNGNINYTNSANNMDNLNNINILENTLNQKDISSNNNAHTINHGQILENILTSEARANLSDKLKALGADTSQLELIKDGKIENKELLNMVKTLLNNPNNASLAESLFSSKEYTEVLRQVIKQQWLVEPENLKEPDKMANLYKQMDEQTRQISSMLETIGKESSNAFKDVSSVRSNLNFMEQINQNFTYLQIPVQFSNEEAHSDLYVYTNKKNLKNHDGKLSVLLHLDMEVLGTTDIYIKMSGNSVSAKFSLENKEAIEIVEGNLESFLKRLEDKGYKASAQVGALEKEQDFVEDFLEKDKVVTSLKRYTFDIRA